MVELIEQYRGNAFAETAQIEKFLTDAIDACEQRNLLAHGNWWCFNRGTSTIVVRGATRWEHPEIPPEQRPAGYGPLRPSSIAWDHHYGIMLPLYVVTLYALLTGAPLRLQGSGLLLLALSWCLSASLLPQLRAIDLPPWNIVQAYVFFGATMLLGLMLVLARPSARHGRVKSPQPHHARP